MIVYAGVDLATERGLPLDVSIRLDLGEADLSAAALIFQGRLKRGSETVLLDLRSAEGGVEAQAVEGGVAVSLAAPRAQMMAIKAGSYAYGLLAAWPDGAQQIICEGAWIHRDVIVTQEG